MSSWQYEPAKPAGITRAHGLLNSFTPLTPSHSVTLSLRLLLSLALFLPLPSSLLPSESSAPSSVSLPLQAPPSTSLPPSPPSPRSSLSSQTSSRGGSTSSPRHHAPIGPTHPSHSTAALFLQPPSQPHLRGPGPSESESRKPSAHCRRPEGKWVKASFRVGLLIFIVVEILGLSDRARGWPGPGRAGGRARREGEEGGCGAAAGRLGV
jgi:hypothetical protein